MTEPEPQARPGRTRRVAALVARRLGVAALLLGCSALGALALGSVWGTTQASHEYRVQSRLIPQSEVEIPTSVGRAVFDTHALAPGVRLLVSLQALPPVSRTASSSHIDIDAQIDQITELARSALIGTAWRSGVGALVGGLLGGVLWTAVSGRSLRRGRQLARVTVAGTTASAVCVAVWGGLGWVTFDDEYGTNMHADGLLAVGLSADRLLAQLNAHDQQYAGYVQSLATYISRIQQLSAADEEREVDVTRRVLLVSDIHGRNIYPQLAEVVRNQDVDFVVDSGDLVQWGTSFELSARPDISEGIQSLGVPYVFVKGNHDSVTTAAQLREVPNVEVLNGTDLELDGLHLVGVGDPRLYQDGGPVEQEQPEVVADIERDRAAQAADSLPDDLGPVDLAVMHHPEGARELGELLHAKVWVSGHTHKPALEVAGDHVDITVGTTGAAGIRTFKHTSDEGEIEATPQSFDILGFNAYCDPVSLTRFSYPDSLTETGTALVTYRTLRLEPSEAAEAGDADGEAAPTPPETDPDGATEDPARRCA